MSGSVNAEMVVGQEAWVKELEFLKYHGMYNAYVYLCSVAQSRAHLNRLFRECLSDHCRVLRDDWVRIEQAWHKVSRPGRVDLTLSPEFISERLREMCPTLGLVGYYSNALFHKTGHMSKNLWHLRYVRNSKQDEYTPYEPGLNFWVNLFGRDFRLGCWADPKNLQGKAYAVIAIRQNDLTESLTHQFLSIKANRFDGNPFAGIAFRDEHNPDRYLCYALPGDEIMRPVHRKIWRKFVAMNYFCKTLRRLLVEAGLPVQGVYERSWKRY